MEGAGCRSTIANSRLFRTTGSLMSTFASARSRDRPSTSMRTGRGRPGSRLHRRTRAGTGPAGDRPLKILLLGGSSLWGFGARDDQTIPSLIARGLHERGIRAEVRNLAEIGYVNTQEVIALFRELQQGYRPDLVLFYDGVNDTTSALLEGQPTVTTNEVNRVREFNILQSPGRLASAFAGYLVRNSALFRLAESIGRRSGLGRFKEPRSPGSTNQVLLAAGVIRAYSANLELVEVLGKAYGFRPVFVWQPDIFSKPKLVPFEAEEKAKLEWAGSLFAQVHGQLERTDELASNRAFVNLSGFFSETDSLQFLDFCHTTEAANGRITAVLVTKLIEIAKTAQGTPASMR